MDLLSRLSRSTRFATRLLGRSPGFALSVIATLAVVLGPGVALLSLVEQIYWRNLPLPHPEELVVFDTPQGPYSGSTNVWSNFSTPLSYPEYETFATWRDSPFSGVAARAPVTLALAFESRTDEIIGELVTGSYFDTLGVRPALGRLLAPDDDRVVAGHPIVVLSWGAWQRRFGGQPDVVGKPVTINGRSMTVVGVAMRDFQSFEIGFTPELWLPMKMKPVATPLRNDLDNARSRWLNIIARLKPGQTRESAEALANVVYRHSSEEIVKEITSRDETFHQRFVDRHLTLLPGARGRSDLRGRFGQALISILALVGLLFALACANLANLFTARATRQERTLTVRLAVGATRRDLVRQLLAEAGVLSLFGVAAGAALAIALPRALPNLLPEELAGIVPTVSPSILAIAAGLAVLATLGSGLLPALAATRGELGERLRATAGAALGGRRHARLRQTLVAVQVALSALILIGAALLVRSVARLAERDPGYRTADVLTFAVNPRLTGYDLETESATSERILGALAEIPGVVRVGRAEGPLLADSIDQSSVHLAGREAPADGDNVTRVDVVDAGFFEGLELPLRSGRLFQDADRRDGAPVAIVNQAFVDHFLSGDEALGEHVRVGRRDAEAEIVGVVGNTLTGNLREDEAPFLYRPYAQAHDGSSTVFVVRTAGDPTQLANDVRRAVASIDPQLPVVDLRPLAEQASRSLALERQTATIAAGLGLTAAALAAIGLYGVLAYLVDARRRELALRTVLGARPMEIGRVVVARAASPVMLGLGVGLALALAGGRYLSSLLFGIGARDPLAFSAVSLGLLAIAFAAAAIPAARAIAIEPATVLRDE